MRHSFTFLFLIICGLGYSQVLYEDDFEEYYLNWTPKEFEEKSLTEFAICDYKLSRKRRIKDSTVLLHQHLDKATMTITERRAIQIVYRQNWRRPRYRYIDVIKKYDAESRIIYEKKVDLKEIVETTWTYDKTGHILTTKETTTDEDLAVFIELGLGLIEETRTYHYDEKMNLMSITKESDRKKELSEGWKYDSLGRKIEHIEFLWWADKYERIVYAYNDNGKLNSERTYRSDGASNKLTDADLKTTIAYFYEDTTLTRTLETQGKTTYERWFDANGNWTRACNILEGEFQPCTSFICVYENGLLISEKRIEDSGSEGENSDTFYKYDAAGRKIEETLFVEGKPDYLMRWYFR